jgi:hypothetical protein
MREIVNARCEHLLRRGESHYKGYSYVGISCVRILIAAMIITHHLIIVIIFFVRQWAGISVVGYCHYL